MILPDLKVLIQGSDNSKIGSKLFLNTGTEIISNQDKGYCSPKSFLPIEDWSTPNEIELENLLITNQDISLHYSQIIKIISIPSEIHTKFQSIEISSITNKKGLEEVSKQAFELGYFNKLMDFINHRSLPFEEEKQNKLYINGFTLNEPGQRTVTVDGAQGECKVGLHLDSWEKLPIHHREKAMNRICVNFSKEARFLLFINLSMKRVLLLLQKKLGGSRILEKMSPPEFVSLFLSNFPNYPVCKLKICPGEAYIAPTENMIHDGCSLGMIFPTITFTVRGKFG